MRETEEIEVEILVRANGPYRIKGPVRLVDADGQPYEVATGKAMFLCRCGLSSKKPFCDGSHARGGFDAA